jgi:dethiobiotin synthetase
VTANPLNRTIYDLPFTSNGFFVTGTDTGVGKTLVACGLLRACAALGLRAIGMKPVAAGAHVEHGRLVNDDVRALGLSGNVAAPGELVNPYCFEPPIAPHIAAAQAGVLIDLDRVKHAFLQLAAAADCVIVEGAGGFRVPLGPHTDASDLAATLGLPVVLVVGMRLGCINHALLTASAVRSAGLPLAGWVANHVDPAFACGDENMAALRERLHAPMLARIPYGENADPALVASRLSVELLRDSSAVKR